jgi:hypothetical protein
MTCNIEHVKQTNDMQTIVRCNHAQLTTNFYFVFFENESSQIKVSTKTINNNR